MLRSNPRCTQPVRLSADHRKPIGTKGMAATNDRHCQVDRPYDTGRTDVAKLMP